MRRILILLLVATAVPPLGAQWRVTLLSASPTARGDARNDADPARPEFHADHPSIQSLAVARDVGRWRAGVEVRRTTADLSEVSRDISVTTGGVFEAWGTGIEVGVRLAGTGARGELRAGLALDGDRWHLAGGAARWRAAARGALELDLPVSHRLGAVIRGEATTGPSVFLAGELPEGFARRDLWRTGIAIGLAWSGRSSAAATRP